MKLRCGSCGSHFDVAASDKPRCPNCLRTLGLAADAPEAVASAPKRWSRWNIVGVALAALALAGIVGGIVLAQRQAGDDQESRATTPLEELPPAEAARRRGAAERLVAEGRALLTSNKLREANRKAEQALREAPRLAAVRQLRGEIYRASGALREAQGEFTAALSIEETPERHIMAGQSLALLDELDRAEHHLQRARTLAPDDPGPAKALAIFYWSTQRSEGLDALRQSLRGGPDGGTPSPLLAEVEATLTEAQALEERRQAQLAERLTAARAAAAAAAATPPDGGAPDAPTAPAAPDAPSAPTAAPATP